MDYSPAPLYLFVGRTASGKETQSTLLAKELQCPMFMTGARFRELIASGSPLGERIKADYEKGLLMPSWVATYMFQHFLFKLSEKSSAVFEGTGRAESEARMFEEVCAWLGRPYTVFNLEVSEDEVVRRSLARARADGLDRNESVIRTRLQEFTKTTKPAIDYFRSIGKLIDINGEQSVDAIHDEVMHAITSA